MKQHYDEKLQRQICLNKQCGETIFISGLMGPDTTYRGIDRQVEYSRDEKGPFVLCPKCGAKHTVLEIQREPGEGVGWKIIGLRQ